MVRKIGLITIGQSPRKDLVEEITFELNPHLKIIEKGALDFWSAETIAEKLTPNQNEAVLVTKLNTGVSVIVALNKMQAMIKQKIMELEQENVEVILLLCTEKIPDLQSNAILIEPRLLLNNLLPCFFKQKKILVLVPHQRQVKAIQRYYQQMDLSARIMVLNPFADLKNMLMGTEALKDICAVVLDCMGYNLQHQQLLQQKTNLPVLLPRKLLNALLKSLCGGGF